MRAKYVDWCGAIIHGALTLYFIYYAISLGGIVLWIAVALCGVWFAYFTAACLFTLRAHRQIAAGSQMPMARGHKIASTVALVLILAIPCAVGVLMYMESTALKMAQSSSVVVGMSVTEVTAILGPPYHTQSVASGESAILWHATDGLISVVFGKDDRATSVSAMHSGRLAMMLRRLGL